jgi:hypothetical protein
VSLSIISRFKSISSHRAILSFGMWFVSRADLELEDRTRFARKCAANTVFNFRLIILHDDHMSLYSNATKEQQINMSFIPFLNPSGNNLITVSTCSFVVLKGTANQLLTLYAKATEQNLLSAIFTSTMSFNGIIEIFC